MTKKTAQKSHNETLWIVTEGLIGTENQCIGVADHLPYSYEVKRVELNFPWKNLSPYLGLECSATFKTNSAANSLISPWPDILITSGRKSVAVARYIKKKTNGRVFSVHIQDPKIYSKKIFDLIALPHHDAICNDSLRGKNNVIITDGSPNKVSATSISEGRSSFDFSMVPQPRIAVLIGGKSKAYDMSAQDAHELGKALSGINAALMVTCSRRTGHRNIEILREYLDTPQNYFWDNKGINPYWGFLGWADYIMVTADSASMISEACTTGKPVFMIPMQGGARRIQAFHDHLISKGVLRVFSNNIEDYAYEPLNDAQNVANEVKKRFIGFTQALR